jgi:hypothetical protein
MVQIIASANSVYQIPWPTSFSAFLDVLKLFLVDLITLTKANCAQPINFYASLTMVLLVFKAVVGGVLFLSWALPRARRWWRDYKKWRSVPAHARGRNVRRRNVTKGRRRSVMVRMWTTDWVKVC